PSGRARLATGGKRGKVNCPRPAKWTCWTGEGPFRAVYAGRSASDVRNCHGPAFREPASHYGRAGAVIGQPGVLVHVVSARRAAGPAGGCACGRAGLRSTERLPAGGETAGPAGGVRRRLHSRKR